MEERRNSYKNSGVDLNAGYETVELIKPHAKRTFTKEVLGGIGNFGGMFCPNFSGFKEPVLVAGADGVGTKIKIAEKLNNYSTIGIDCVAMCANDVICSGAKPLFFLDYISCGKNNPKKIESIISGVSTGCIEANAALIGGETAEHPGIMGENEFDLAGFLVGVVEKNKAMPRKNLSDDDVLVALTSSGVHSNGFSLIRKIFNPEKTDFSSNFNILEESLGETLLKPTKIYVKPLLSLLEQIEIKAACHITGGGFFENIPRVLNKNYNAIIHKANLKVPKIFKLIMEKGKVEENEMFGVFNMGVGMILILTKENAQKAVDILNSEGIESYVLGELEKGTGKVEIVN